MDTLLISIKQILIENGLKPGDSLHSWRCADTERFGNCDCLDQLAQELVYAVQEAGLDV